MKTYRALVVTIVILWILANLACVVWGATRPPAVVPAFPYDANQTSDIMDAFSVGTFTDSRDVLMNVIEPNRPVIYYFRVWTEFDVFIDVNAVAPGLAITTSRGNKTIDPNGGWFTNYQLDMTPLIQQVYYINITVTDTTDSCQPVIMLALGKTYQAWLKHRDQFAWIQGKVVKP